MKYCMQVSQQVAQGLVPTPPGHFRQLMWRKFPGLGLLTAAWWHSLPMNSQGRLRCRDLLGHIMKMKGPRGSVSVISDSQGAVEGSEACLKASCITCS